MAALSAQAFPKLEGTAIDLKRIRNHGKTALRKILQQVPGPKCVVLGSDLLFPLNLITEGVDLFKSEQVKEFKELGWSKLSTKKGLNTVIYIVRPGTTNMKQIALHMHQPDSIERRFAIFFMPQRTFLALKILKDEGVYPRPRGPPLLIGSCAIDLIPFDDDMLSLELSSCSRDCYLSDDTTSMSMVAGSLKQLQRMFGPISHVKCKGALAKIAYDLWTRMEKEDAGSKDSNHAVEGDIDTLILIDRSIDWVSPLVTPLTYEALIDEIIGIKHGVVEIEPDEAEIEAAKKENRKPIDYLRLNNNDELFMKVRDSNISQIGPFLQEKSRHIRKLYQSRPTQDGTVKDIQDFVKKIPHLQRSFQSVQHHISITEKVTKRTNSKTFRAQWLAERQMMESANKIEYIEDCIARQEPLITVIRLLCLQSIFGNGFKERQYNQLRTLIIHTYGFEVLLSLQNLEQLGLFRKRGSRDDPMAEFQWNKIKQEMSLIYNKVKDDDIAYVTSGYAPILGRLVQWALDNRWDEYRDTIERLPGPMLEVSHATTSHDSRGTGARSQRETDGKRKVVLVYVLGGITFMEIAALRFLSKSKDCAFDVVIATTQFVNGQTLTESLMEQTGNFGASAV